MSRTHRKSRRFVPGVAACCVGACTSPASAPDAAVATQDAARDAATVACNETAGPFAPWSTRCGHLVDASGRVVVVHGINARIDGVFDVTLDGGRIPLQPIPAFGVEDARRMRALGFNLLRIPMQWSGVEPTETGGFDTTYLDRVAAAVAAARAGGLHVLLDLHQDAYSKEIGEDGAPLWAIVPPPERLLQGPLTDLAERRTSAQVLRAFGTFFGDGADGGRLRTRYAAMAAAVARRFDPDPTVIGLELYNEPVAPDPQVWRLHAEIAPAVRAASPRMLLVFEPDATRRLLLNRSQMPSAPFPVPGGVYAPHTYPLAFSGTEAQRNSFTFDSLRPAVDSARAEADAWRVPLLITEWGYDPRGIRAEAYHRYLQDAQAEAMAGAMYWLWKEQSQGSWGLHDYDDASNTWRERASVRRMLARVRPEAIAGTPMGWSWDADRRVFSLRFEGRAEVTTPHRLYLPETQDIPGNWTARCDAAPAALVRDAATGVAEVRCHGPGPHLLTVTADGA
jgi:endoglycosylceramidase